MRELWEAGGIAGIVFTIYFAILIMAIVLFWYQALNNMWLR